MTLRQALAQRARLEAFQQRHRLALLTIVFTDIVGSVQLKQRLGDRSAWEIIQEHHGLVRACLQGFEQGEEIETAGDSFFLVFGRPSDAVKFSLVLTARLRALAEQRDCPILDRIGVHVGEVFVEDEEDSTRLFGTQVDIAARVMSLAVGGQILMTRFAFDNARQVLEPRDIARSLSSTAAGEPPPLVWANHGLYLFKGFDEPCEVCEVRVGAAHPLESPASSEKASRYALPGSDPVLGWRPAVVQTIPGTEWELQTKLGEGGFGEVWLGVHQRLKEKRVFKFCFRADRVRALKREVTLFRLFRDRIGDHRHMIRLLDVFFDQPPYFIAEEYVAGRDLKTWCEGRGGVKQVPLAVRLELVAQAADALQAAHQAGIIHRDVKPGNILVSGDWISEPKAPHSGPVVKLTDFGIGQLAAAALPPGMTCAGFTQTVFAPGSSGSGTQMYMAPELLRGRPASPQSDLYSLGIVLYQFLLGDFSLPLTTDWRRKIRDPLLEADLEGCLAGEPEERWPGAQALSARLRGYRRRRLIRDWLQPAVGAVLALVLGFLAWPMVEGISCDLLFRLRANLRPDEVVIVEVDDATLDQLRTRWPLDRAVYARFLDQLKAAGARMVVMDIILAEPGPDLSAADELVRAIRDFGPVILGAARESGGQTILWTRFAEAALGAGDVSFVLDRDGKIRRHHDPQPPNALQPLSWVAAQHFARLRNQSAPVASLQNRWINYYGPPSTLPAISFYRVLDTNRFEPDLFKDKAVFVGWGKIKTSNLLPRSRENAVSDLLPTPFGSGPGEQMTGVELEATLFLNLIRGDWLRRFPAPAEIGLFVAVGLGLGFGLARCRPLKAAALGWIAGAVLVLASVILFGEYRLWYAWMVPVCVQMPVAVAWTCCRWWRSRI